MQEILFWLITLPVVSIIGMLMARQWRQDYPLSSGAVDYKRIAWPVGKSGVLTDRDGQSFIGYQPTKSEDTMGIVPPRFIAPQSITSDNVTDEMITSNNAAILATGLKLVEHGYLTEEQLRRDLASVDIMLPTPSTGYTPLLSLDEEQVEPETWNEALLRNLHMF